MRKPAGIALTLLFLAALALPLWALQQGGAARSSHLLLIIPFENAAGTLGNDWIGESFPEILATRLSSSALFVMGRDDRLSAFDRLGIPSTAKPSRATIYQIAQQLDADYVLLGNYAIQGQDLAVHARLMDVERLRLGPELEETGPLTNLATIQTALAWDVLKALDAELKITKNEFSAKFAPQRADALEHYVRGVLAANDQERVRQFKEALRLEPANTLAMLQLGKSYYSMRDYEATMNWLARIPVTDPSSTEAQFYLAMAAFYSGHMEKAESAFRTVALRMPLTEIYNNLGVVLARRADSRARTYFEKCAEADPNEPDYHFNLAVQLYREGDPQGAGRELHQMLALAPDNEAKTLLDAIMAGTRPARFPLERIKRNYDESSFRQLALEIENMNEARLEKASPAAHAAFHIQHGTELLESGLAEEAGKQFREAVMLEPASAEAHAGLARALEAGQDSAAARNEARMSLKLKPTTEAYLVLARLDLADNKPAAAAQNVDRALALDPANTAAVELKHDIAAGRFPQP